ncbi:MAG TPA: trifunctional glycosyltransferase/class I SAM-dependent methyltransferase/polysaccharide deacetylase [Vicinamibacterales bacterium]|nr:trifunctional glycosyltransferase/class I SAM-dependent methyltransferase/polysaccharide deacetylase [Vicinamibacterales bacterium]
MKALNTGRIAVIVTCRDLGRTLADALDSVARQTRRADEILVVDDRSNDIYTRQVLARLEQQGTRVVRGDGRGPSAARNLGARETSSDYLVWLDADDVLEPAYLDEAAARLDGDRSLEFVTCAMRAFGDADYSWRPSNPTFVDAIATGGVPHASTMMRRSLWARLGGFDETLSSFELFDFWATAFERGARGIVIDEPLLRYRVRAGSGYRRSIQTDTYLARMRHFYGKHREAVERHGPELLVGREAFIEGQRGYQRELETRAASLESELADLKRQIAGVTGELESRGRARVEWGDLRRVRPLSDRWGRDRGTAIDRHYIEAFLDRHRGDIRGRVLEVRDSAYTQRFGGDRVERCDVVDIDSANPAATIVADLRRADPIASNTYDCIILTQTLHLVDDMPAVLGECGRMLRPGGVLLLTGPSVIRVDDERGVDGDFWRLTEASARKLFGAVFPVDGFDVSSYGSVLSCAAFLYGVSVEEMKPADLEPQDPKFPLVIAVRAVKPRVRVRHEGRAVILCYHRIADLTPDAHALCTPPGVFRAHMRTLSEQFAPIALDDLVRLAEDGSIPDNAVAVTFDDGYLDALTTASPILMEFGIPATFFVNSDRLDEPHERWWDIVERVVRDTTVADALNARAWPMDARGRAQLLAEVLASTGADASPRSSHRVMTTSELGELASRPGHTIGGHTTNHLALTLHGRDAKRREIADDRAALGRALGRPVDLFSYPYGDFDGETVAVVREAGYRAAVTVASGVILAGCDRLLLPRYEVPTRERVDLATALLGLFAASRSAKLQPSVIDG